VSDTVAVDIFTLCTNERLSTLSSRIPSGGSDVVDIKVEAELFNNQPERMTDNGRITWG
jgi:hypothetical protein